MILVLAMGEGLFNIRISKVIETTGMITSHMHFVLRRHVYFELVPNEAEKVYK